MVEGFDRQQAIGKCQHMEYVFYLDMSNGVIDNGAYCKHSFPYSINGRFVSKVNRVRGRKGSVGGKVIKDRTSCGESIQNPQTRSTAWGL